MNRWGVRIAGLLMLLFFALVFVAMYKQMAALQKNRPAPTSTTTSTR
ncbi:MAG TPA: hypothetical protein VGJ81_02955 [Thermoanaerobaculia bacterium]|jgi:hypothetical protein